MANSFNDFFANVANNLVSNLPPSSYSPLSFMPNCREFYSFYLSPTSVDEILYEISNLNLSKSCGPFSIPITILKLLKHQISLSLVDIFNCSFSTSTVPDKFKIASVIPVHEQGSKFILNNYCPISLLSIFSRILEKIVCKQLDSFIVKHNLLYENQYGFRSKHSTLHAVISITDKIQKAIDQGYYSCGIFLDLSKAFDTVNHPILLDKLEYYGIRGLAKQWFESYLMNRMQFVSLGSCKSDMLNISSGVPQGSVLGPILFLLYINDFSNCSTILDFHLFADDTNIFHRDKSLSNLESTINNQLSYVIDWLSSNKLTLNADKSSFIVFHPTLKKIY